MANAESIGAGDVPVLLDAPVSGGVVGAEAATLTFMVLFLVYTQRCLHSSDDAGNTLSLRPLSFCIM